MAHPTQRLEICFESSDAFRGEYDTNLVNGGVFVPTDAPLALRDAVEVELRLADSDVAVRLSGEVAVTSECLQAICLRPTVQ